MSEPNEYLLAHACEAIKTRADLFIIILFVFSMDLLKPKRSYKNHQIKTIVSTWKSYFSMVNFLTYFIIMILVWNY